MTKLRVVAASSCLALLAGCSSGGVDPGSTPRTSPSVAPSTPTGSPTGSATGSPTSSDVSGGTPTTDLKSVLLTPAEVGTGYTLAASQTEGGSPLPCTPSAAPLFTQAPPGAKANQNNQNAGDTVEISEVVAGYGDAAGSARAYRLGAAGFTCTSGTLGGKKVTIAKRADGAPAGSSVDDLGAWDFAAEGLKGTAILVRVGSKLIGLTFVATPAAAAAVPVGEITERAATKVLKAG